VLSDAELATWLKWLPTSKLSASAKDALLLTLLTGARSGEVVGAATADVVDGKWTISENKTDAPRTVVLSTQAKAVFEQRAKGKWFFPSPQGGHIAQTALVYNVVLHRATSGLASWASHDLRRSCRTGLARLGCPREVAEAALGHSKAGIVGVYDLHRYEREVGEWLQKWADHLYALAQPNVVPIRKKA
jgi:integrase